MSLPATNEAAGSALFIVCAYGLSPSSRLETGFQVPSIVSRLLFPNLRAFVATYRDFYANPRSLEYMLERAAEFREEAGFQSVTTLVDSAWFGEEHVRQGDATDDAPGAPTGSVDLRRSPPVERNTLEAHDNIVLFYPDALGLGRSRLEAEVLAVSGSGAILIVNGRRRRFMLDPRMRRALAWRRLLARTRICELLFAVAVVPVSAVLAATDALTGRSRS